MTKEKAREIIEERISDIRQATNQKEVKNREYYACGAANALWAVGIFTQKEHNENFDKIKKAAEKREAEYLRRK